MPIRGDSFEMLPEKQAGDKVRTFSIRVTVLAKDAERVGAELYEFLAKQNDATPGYAGSFSYKDEEV
jgi:hypothetical protein